jgi:spore coat protein U-like protein
LINLAQGAPKMKSFRLNRTAAALCVAMGTVLMSSLPAYAAGTANTNLAVSASVASNCTISTLAVAFGAYDPIVTNAVTALNGNGSITIACTKGSVPTLKLDLGATPAGAVRQMASGTERLPYELYQPLTNVAGAACGALTQIWGTAGAAILTTVAAPSKAARTYNVCGTVPGGADVAVGAYADTVIATVTF